MIPLILRQVNARRTARAARRILRAARIRQTPLGALLMFLLRLVGR